MKYAMVREKINRDENGNIDLINTRVKVVRLDDVDQNEYVFTEMISSDMHEYVHKDDVLYFTELSKKQQGEKNV